MPDEKKPIDLTTEEVMRELFPPKAIEKLKEMTRCDDESEVEELDAE